MKQPPVKLFSIKMRVAIIEPCLPIGESLKDLLYNLFPSSIDIQLIQDYNSAQLLLLNLQPQIAFVNPEFLENKGNQFIDTCKDVACQLITISDTTDYAYRAFRANAIDYLLSPFDAQLVEAALQKAANLVALLAKSTEQDPRSSSKLVIPKSKGFEVIHPDQLIYGQTEGNYGRLIFKNRNRLTVNLNMKRLEEYLSPFGFFRIHQSYIVNLTEVEGIDSLEDHKVSLSDGTQLPVARRKRTALL